jgi:hypothetical protein
MTGSPPLPKPDFSGRWTLDRQACALSAAAAAFEGGVVRIEHREPAFHYQAAMVAGGNTVEYTFELVSDGGETVATNGEQRIVSSLRWDGAALVSRFNVQGPGGEVTIEFRYELLDGGRRLRAAERLRGGGRDQDNLWVFERSDRG